MSETVTMEQWENHVKINCHSSYGLAHCLVALMIAEHPSDDPKKFINQVGLTGLQASHALSIAEQIKPLFAKQATE